MATAKKPAAKKKAVKRPAAKKTAVEKTVAKKVVAKEPAAKKITAKKKVDYTKLLKLIESGKNAVRLDLAGPEPPLQMPAWKNKLSPKQIQAILGYFISLMPDDEDEPENV